MIKKTLLLIVLLLTGWCYANAGDYVSMSGNIGPYTIVMNINPSAPSGNNCGYYYYTDKKHPRRAKFKLVMGQYNQINASGSVKMTLYEFSPSGNNTGTFRGQFESRSDYYEGTFTNSKGKKFHFRLYSNY